MIKKTFDKNYPDFDIIKYNGSLLIKSNKKQLCNNCGERLSSWVDNILQLYVCSPSCEEAIWKKYFKTLKEYRKVAAR